MTKVTICNMPHFKAFGMRNLQYEIETCNRIHNKGTMSRWQIQVTIFFSGTDFKQSFYKVFSNDSYDCWNFILLMAKLRPWYCRAVYNAENLIFHDYFFDAKYISLLYIDITYLLPNYKPESVKISWDLYCRAVCIAKNFFEPQNPRFIIESNFKSRAGYNSAHTVYCLAV